MWVVVGLGNPDAEYAGTRHNVGFAVVDRLAARLGVRFRAAAHGAATARGRLGDTPVLLVKPLTFMNRSGGPVAAWLREAGADATALIVAHDDADFALGRLRVRPGGGPAGHRGVASIVEALATTAFIRVRIGIGRPPEREDMVAHVLGSPDGAEAAVLEAATARAADALEAIIGRGVAAAMNASNVRSPAGPREPKPERGSTADRGPTAQRGEVPDGGREAAVAKEVSARARV